MNEERIIAGRNPVSEALKSGRSIEKLLVAKGASGALIRIVAQARDAGIAVEEADKRRLDSLAENNQGVVAFADAVRPFTLDEMLESVDNEGMKPFFVALDGIEDPHNLGAIARSAECAGANGVIIPKNRSAGLTPTAQKAAAGAFEHIKIARVVNLHAALDRLKKRGVWVYGAEAGGKPYTEISYSGPKVIVIGSEGGGLSRLTAEKCDFIVSIPMRGRINSLNASCAAAVLLFEAGKSL